MRLLIASIFSTALLLPTHVVAQTLKPGEWQTYTSMRSVTDIAVSSDSFYVWAATGGGAFRADLRDAQATLQPLRTTDGLTENDVTAVAADAEGNIYFGEGGGGFDLYNSASGTVNRQSDIRNSNFTDKAINSITLVGDTVYLATGYGISVYFPLKGVFGATASQIASLPTEDSIRQVIDNGSYVYAAAHEGVAWTKNTSDLHAGTNWHLLPDSGGSVRSLANFNGTVYAGAENGLYAISPDRDSLIPVILPVSVAVNRLLVANDSLYILDTSGVLYSTKDLIHLASRAISTDAGSNVTAIAFSPNNGIIAGSLGNGIGYSVAGNFNPNIFPSGPITNSTTFLHFATATDRLYETNLALGFGVFQPENDSWQDFRSGVGTTPSPIFLQVLYDSVRRVTWFSTQGSPLYRVDSLISGTPIWHPIDQTQIPNVDGSSSSNYINSIGMMIDAENNFVVTTYAGNGKGLSISSDGEHFTNYTLGSAIEPWGCVTQDLNGNYWVGTPANGAPHSTGVYWLNPTNNSYGVIYGGSSGTLGPAIEGTEYVNAILTDQDDGIWCGTEGGVEIISNPEAILQSNQPQFSIRSVQLVASQVVHTMAVDGVGNKWIGTDNGIFVVSPDGSDSVAHFTAENSPLVDDEITSLVIDPNRGEAYAGTPSGISRFSTIFKQGRPDYSGIRVYPNPVVQTAEQSPTVYIDGLVAGSTVQIFSLAGQLVATIDGTALGSTVPWNGRDAIGHQVPSGMYLISATSPQSGGNGETKVVIVRKPSN
jgi:ligand-binding sensor domain-containing protein